MMHCRTGQQGVALITVLLIVALITLLASEMISRHFLDIRKARNLIYSSQAEAYALGGEAWARQILYRDYQNRGPVLVDHSGEEWATLANRLTMPDGELDIRIRDLQGLFNLNNLVDANGAVRSDAVQRFQNLQQQRGTEGDHSASLRDWLDRDDAPDELAAYPDSYPANQWLADRSELLAVAGVTPEDYQRLAPHISALPAVTRYNLNTLDEEVLAALQPALTSNQRQAISQRQQQGGYTSVNDWLANEAAALGVAADSLAISSDYFEVTVITRYAERLSRLRTVLYRNPANGELQVIQRQFGLIDE